MAEPILPLPALLTEAKDVVIEELHRRMAEEGFDEIRPAHGCVFRFVDAEGTRLTALAARSGLTKQAVGEVTDHLEQLGYVERAPDPSDGRAKIIRLTERGRDARAAADRLFVEIERLWGERYGEERIALLRETLEAIAAGEQAAAVAA